jgi:YbbR domain-containing protein
VLSVLLWITILGEPELVTTHTTPILYKNLPKILLIGPDAPDVVRVELRGPSSKLTPANLSQLAVLLDLAGVNDPGERTFTLADGDIHLPQGVTFLRAVPSQLRLRFARLQAKDVPVQVRITDPPPGGYRVVAEEVTPKQLRIAGPERRVEETGSAETDGIDLSTISKTSEFRVNAFIADPQVYFDSSPIVTVKITIEKAENPN